MKLINSKNARFMFLLAFLTQFATWCIPNQSLSYEGRIHPVTPPGKEESISVLDEKIMISLKTKEGYRLLSMREYLIGVVQAELPATFSLQAMKAQAVAARTVAIKKMMQGKELCDDPNCCQAYSPAAPVQQALQAVEQTDGEILVYEDELIEAVYFSCSGGMTEAAVDVWGNEVPYLRSVASPGEEKAPHYEEKITIPLELFRQILRLEAESIQIEETEYTAGTGVKTITIGGKSFTGTQLRSLFDLRSTCFDLQLDEQSVTFFCKGFGHRVGMSQYGAQAMAESGADYQEILAYYFNGAEIKKQS